MIAAGIVLAAGRSSRMGAPKALLIIDGEALVARHIRRLRELACARVVVVAPSAIRSEVQAICEPALVLGRDTSSQAASLREALRALEAEAALPGEAIILITPVDVLPVRSDTIRALVEALHAGASAAVPSKGPRHGHPVLARRHLLDPYKLDDDPPPLNHHLAPHRTLVPTEDTNTQTNLNHPHDLPLDPRSTRSAG